MTDPYDKRQGRLEDLLRGLLPPEESQDLKLSPEDQAFLDPLGVNALKLINGLYRRFEEVDFGPESEEQRIERDRETRREIEQLDRMDKAGLLAPHWWQDYVPAAVAQAMAKSEGGGACPPSSEPPSEPPSEPESEPRSARSEPEPASDSDPEPRAPAHDPDPSPPIMGPLGKPPPVTPRVVDFLDRRRRR